MNIYSRNAHTDYINSTTVCALLHKIRTLNPLIPISLFLDNARYQRCDLVTQVAAELKIELDFLPSYSPNLNLIERLWKFVKKKCLYGKYYSNFDTFTTSIQSCLAQTKTTYFTELKSLLALNFQSFENCNQCPC